ncbi:MAG: V-type ATP synthase subunit F [Peptoniphilaceae bacterium]|nr:V-type ATP synthase subunit F [Peptoniphilaceae bacterium]MDY6018932.1 V-type ATP synthase subunit F [Anaerococcus sp.]
MKAKIITDNNSLLLGFRLGGITGELITDKTLLAETFYKFSKEKDLALIIFTKSSYNPISELVEDFREHHTTPLIVVLD